MVGRGRVELDVSEHRLGARGLGQAVALAGLKSVLELDEVLQRGPLVPPGHERDGWRGRDGAARLLGDLLRGVPGLEDPQSVAVVHLRRLHVECGPQAPSVRVDVGERRLGVGRAGAHVVHPRDDRGLAFREMEPRDLRVRQGHRREGAPAGLKGRSQCCYPEKGRSTAPHRPPRSQRRSRCSCRPPLPGSCRGAA